MHNTRLVPAMISRLQPSRPKPPQQSTLPVHAHQQQHDSQNAASSTPLLNSRPPIPRSQIEAMPPFGPPQTPATFFTPLYDSAMRHPVFFTQNLRKPPFPIPQGTSQNWNPVASGYIREEFKREAAGKTKL